MSSQSLIMWIVIGLVAGWLASFVVGGGGLIRYLISGLIGSFVGGLILQWTGLNIPVASPFIRDVLVSAMGAIVVILIARAVV
ncbi:GlsB/YeaQ/YmgE family stress response membrane protein [Oryzibacter oryziterrae]|uniref:GlsB/YeaQ/YmgE family stress response membrane protein n=1 Tax=Oryzibacter oryziterrae TaxID=2766474 RepID=UPI001F0198E8|nr:GlsB/YeaQ/YmgE family stress response membrane protein [Oryzibacter oryziterrae]